MRNILSQFSSTPKVEIDDPMEGQQTQDAEMVSADAVPTEPEQVPYVPAASRTTKTKAAKKDKDEVVTVKKAKKRKAEVVPPAPEATSEAVAEVEPSPAKRTKVNEEKAKGKKKAVKVEEIPDFDYSQEPNQLDTFAPESTTGKIKKQKKPKKRKFEALLCFGCQWLTPCHPYIAAIVDTSAFRKPPQNPSDLSAGNRSRTFKK